jgi:hypothetical protein
MRGKIAEFFSQKHSMQLITAIDKLKLNPKIGRIIVVSFYAIKEIKPILTSNILLVVNTAFKYSRT